MTQISIRVLVLVAKIVNGALICDDRGFYKEKHWHIPTPSNWTESDYDKNGSFRFLFLFQT